MGLDRIPWLNMPDGSHATSGDIAIALAAIYEQQLSLI